MKNEGRTPCALTNELRKAELRIEGNSNIAKKGRSAKSGKYKLDLSKDLWIAPRLSLRGANGDRAWDRSGNLPPGAGASFLELADLALGIKKPQQKKNGASPTAHETIKKEPYSL